jgi:copper chaperone CopZ
MAKVRSALEKIDGIGHLNLSLLPSRARFTYDADKYSIQDLFKAIHSAGSQYDGRLVLKCTGPEENLTNALKLVAGVRSPGLQDREGVRLVTFLPDKRTMYGDLVKAAAAARCEIAPPPIKANGP